MPDEILRSLAPEHPRLIASADTWDKLKTARRTDALLHAFLTKSEREARLLLDAPPVVYQKDGRRLLRISRTVLRRVLLLALHYHLTGEVVFAQRADQEMQAVAAFSDWNPSHFLDTGEMCLALALGYDWLYDVLPISSRPPIEAAIIQKALSHGLTNEGWQTATNNWNSVCWAGLVWGALAIAESEPETAARIVQKAVKNNGLGLKPYAPDGVYPEGAMYWGYGTTFQVLLIAGLQSALGTNFGLGQSAGFMESASVLLQQLGPTGKFFNFSDNLEAAGMESGLFWFAHTLNRPDLTDFSRAQIQSYVDAPHLAGPDSEKYRTLPLAALWWTSAQNVPNAAPLIWYGRGPTPLAVFRSKWNDPKAMFLACKGGSPSVSHAHMDGGSFVFDANGVRWACDLGMQDYLSLESKGVNMWDGAQNGQRWDVFRIGPFSHNTLTINNQKHKVNGSAHITHFGDKPNETGATVGATVDLTPLFAEQATRVHRGFSFDSNRSVLIKDELDGLKKGDTVRWAMMTRAEIALSPNGFQATLTQNNETLHIWQKSSVRARWEIVPAVPPNDYDAPNPGAHLLVAHFTVPASGLLEIDVVLQPITSENEDDLTWADFFGAASEVLP